MSEVALTKEMSLTTFQRKLELFTITYRQVMGGLLWLGTGSRVDISGFVLCWIPPVAGNYPLGIRFALHEGVRTYLLETTEICWVWILCRESADEGSE